MSRRSLSLLASLFSACSATGGPPSFTTGTVDAGGTMEQPDGWVLVRDAIPIEDRGPTIIGADAACMTNTLDGQRVPTNLMILLDRSGSMNNRDDRNPSMPTRWTAAVAGLTSLLNRLSDNARVGITFFPSGSNSSSASGYENPAVAIAPLRTNRAALLGALRGASPSGNTPMICGFQGVQRYFSRYTQDGSRNVILITDGVPTEECGMDLPMCNLLPPDFACLLMRDGPIQNQVRVAVARTAMSTPPIKVYIAGTPEASDTFLSDLAVIGNTQRTPDCRPSQSCHYRLETASFEADLTMALQDIESRALTCEFQVDADPTRVDPDRVNVNVQGSGMSSPRLIPRDVDHREGWDYSEGRRSIVVYGSACEQIRTDAQVRVQILFGCPTITPG